MDTLFEKKISEGSKKAIWRFVMSITTACQDHARRCSQCSGKAPDVKIFAECIVPEVTHRLVRTYLDSQSSGPNPAYEAIPTSLLRTVVVNSIQDHPPTREHHYQLVLADTESSRKHRVHISTQQVVHRTLHPLKHFKCARICIETVQECKNARPVIPTTVYKENGTTYLPLDSGKLVPGSSTKCFAIEMFELWTAPTFAELETGYLHTEPVTIDTDFNLSHNNKKVHQHFGIRVTALPPNTVHETSKPGSKQNLRDISQTTLLRATTTAKFLDLLIHG